MERTVTHRLGDSVSTNERPETVVWLVPSECAAREISRRLPPDSKVGTFESILSGEVPPSAPASRLRLDQVVAKLSSSEKLAYFRDVFTSRGFIDGAAGLIEEANSVGLKSAMLAKVAKGPRAAKSQACAELLAEWQKGAKEFASPLAAAKEIKLDGIVRIIVRGFSEFTPVEWQILEALNEQAALVFELPFVDTVRPQVFDCIAETRQRVSECKNATIIDAEPIDESDSRPAGLLHLARNLFGPSVPPSDDGSGVQFIEAPGELGEARLVARRICKLIASGVRPERIVVTMRELDRSADLLDEVFGEYGIPVEVAVETPIARNPAVATLMRAMRLPTENWLFASVTALLRSCYFRPDWPGANVDVIRRSESLLRMLGEPHGKENYLSAIELWATKPPEGLEDEGPQESRRLKKARIATECRPFLVRFFAIGDEFPAKDQHDAFVKWMRMFAADIGLAGVANEDASESASLVLLWSELGRDGERKQTRAGFLNELAIVAGTACLPLRAENGRVRVVAAEEARHIDCDYLFVLGLGEKSFPKLSPPTSLLDDSDRNALRELGVPFAKPADRLGREQLLFLQLVGRPKLELTLSFAAVDERGQDLLPGGFLRAAQEIFAKDAVPTERQRMLIEGYTKREAIASAEARVQFAAQLAARRDLNIPQPAGLPAGLTDHLARANQVAHARFRSNDFNRYDGGLENAAALAEVSNRFGPERVFSPTALEDYIACPFKFFFGNVLNLEELDEPSEEVEQTRRGSAFHRALSRLHRSLRSDDPEMTAASLPEHINDRLETEMNEAIAEYARRSSSRATKRLWELEGKRLRRSIAKYRGHWDSFVEPWRKGGHKLSPELMEADFGSKAARPIQSAAATGETNELVIEVGGIVVRIGGTIDRVDVVQLEEGLGYYVIDYKTGKRSYYSSSGIIKMEKLQLPLYALAVEKVCFPGRAARPLGLAYWLVTDTGPKTVLPQRQALGWLSDREKWTTFRNQLEAWVAEIVRNIRAARFPLAPRSLTCTDTCAFGQACRISQSRSIGKSWNMTPTAMEASDE